MARRRDAYGKRRSGLWDDLCALHGRNPVRRVRPRQHPGIWIPRTDPDLDDDLDLADFAALQQCFCFAAEERLCPPVPDECWAFDVDENNAVNATYFTGGTAKLRFRLGYLHNLREANKKGVHRQRTAMTCGSRSRSSWHMLFTPGRRTRCNTSGGAGAGRSAQLVGESRKPRPQRQGDWIGRVLPLGPHESG
jgi:hypothetical protein